MKTQINGTGRWAVIDACPSYKIINLHETKDDAENYIKNNSYRMPCYDDKSFCLFCSSKTKIKEIDSVNDIKVNIIHPYEVLKPVVEIL
jgi:hypothetical protein